MRLESWTSPAGKRRIMTHLDGRERRSLELAVAIAFPVRRTGPSVFGSPARATSLAVERRRWRATIRHRSANARAVLVTDVADCYPSIGERAILIGTARAGGDPRPLLRAIRRYRNAGGDGIPIGPGASGIIADVVLSLADDAARQAGCSPVRWVDDVVFVGDRDAVARAARAWRETLRDLGMLEHEGKRRVGSIHGPGSPAAPSGRGIMRGT